MNNLATLLSQRLELPQTLAELYFLDAGHLLYRRHRGDGTTATKFVTIEDVAAAFTGVETDTGWMAEGVRRAGYCAHGPWFVFIQPPQKTRLTLTTDADGLETVAVPLPLLVFVGVGNQFYVAAAKGDAFDPKAKIAHCPLPNVHTDTHQICYGGNAPPRADAANAAAAWEMFIASPFNNHLAGGKARSEPYSEDIRQLLRRLAEKRARAFPADELVVTGQSVETFIRQKTGQKGKSDD